jgi:poly(A) polymerase
MTQFDWLKTDAPQTVLALLNADEGEGYVVGGCLRNALMGRDITDLDMATSLLPSEVISRAEAAGLRVIPTGIEHGTVTVFAHGIPIEVTTFRSDVETDGRRAKVAFSTSIIEDAKRRDFTMNALYANQRGEVIDPLNGLADIRAGRVRFIGGADDRVAEDYLRILRFFRFQAWYGSPELGLDADALAACAGGIEGLGQIARERIGAEIVKIMSAPDPSPVVSAMAKTGVLNAVFDGAAPNVLPVFVHLSAELGVDPMARLAAVTGDVSRLRLSNAQLKHFEIYRAEMVSTTLAGALGYEYGFEVGALCLALRAALFEQPLSKLNDVRRGVEAVFPLVAADLMPAYSGANLGAALCDAKDRWIASDFALTKDDLIEGLENG